MNIRLLRSKLHGATVTDANIHYRGSITIDQALLEQSGIHEYELVQVVDVNNGSRFETYVILGPRGSGVICVNGAAARLVQPGDKVIIMAFGDVAPHEVGAHRPRVVILGPDNHPQETQGPEPTLLPAGAPQPGVHQPPAPVVERSRPAAYLSSIAHEFGEIERIDSIAEMRHYRELLGDLMAMGLASYSRSERPPLVLASAAVRKTLALAALKAGDVDAVLYCSTSFQEEANYRSGFADFTEATGLSNAYIIGLTLSECANVNLAILQASDMIASGRYRNILVVSADVTHASESRLVPPGISVKSDAAVSFLVSSQPRAGFIIRDSGTRRAERPWGINPKDDVQGYMTSVVGHVTSLFNGLLGANRLDKSALEAVITNNYNSSVIRTLAHTLGVPAERFFERNISAFAHAVAGDTLINLAQYASEHPLRSGQRFVLLGTGSFAWVANLVEAFVEQPA